MTVHSPGHAWTAPGGFSLCFEIPGGNNTPLCSRWNVTGDGEHLQSLRSTLGGGNCGVEGAGTVIRTGICFSAPTEQLLREAIPGLGGDLLPRSCRPGFQQAGGWWRAPWRWRESRSLAAQGGEQLFCRRPLVGHVLMYISCD